MANDLRARLGLKDGGPVKMADGGDLRTRLKLGGGGEVHMQDGGDPSARFMGKAPKRGVSSLPGYGQGINPTPRVVRNYVLDMIGTGQGQLMPFFESKKRPALPDYRTEKKEGGKVSGLSALQQGKRYA